MVIRLPGLDCFVNQTVQAFFMGNYCLLQHSVYCMIENHENMRYNDEVAFLNGNNVF